MREATRAVAAAASAVVLRWRTLAARPRGHRRRFRSANGDGVARVSVLDSRRAEELSCAVCDCGIRVQNAVQWKGESEETVKTRRNALRVIVQKLRTIWPVFHLARSPGAPPRRARTCA